MTNLWKNFYCHSSDSTKKLEDLAGDSLRQRIAYQAEIAKLFLSLEQIDQSQHPLLAQLLQTASGGIPTPNVGTGSGGSTSQSSWDGPEHDPSRRKR